MIAGAERSDIPEPSAKRLRGVVKSRVDKDVLFHELFRFRAGFDCKSICGRIEDYGHRFDDGDIVDVHITCPFEAEQHDGVQLIAKADFNMLESSCHHPARDVSSSLPAQTFKALVIGGGDARLAGSIII